MHGRRIATKRGLRHLLVAIATTVLSMTAMPEALAAPCAGFTDVDDTSGFCPNVEWLKNRAITLGCTSTTVYCPNDPVSRLAMAAFMNRLGTALTPIQVRVDIAPGAVDLDANAVVCQTSDFAVPAGSFPRRAYVDLSFNGNATADVGLAADLVVSTDARCELDTPEHRDESRVGRGESMGWVERHRLRGPERRANRSMGRAHDARRHCRHHRSRRQPLPVTRAGLQPQRDCLAVLDSGTARLLRAFVTRLPWRQLIALQAYRI